MVTNRIILLVLCALFTFGTLLPAASPGTDCGVCKAPFKVSSKNELEDAMDRMARHDRLADAFNKEAAITNDVIKKRVENYPLGENWDAAYARCIKANEASTATSEKVCDAQFDVIGKDFAQFIRARGRELAEIKQEEWGHRHLSKTHGQAVAEFQAKNPQAVVAPVIPVTPQQPHVIHHQINHTGQVTVQPAPVPVAVTVPAPAPVVKKPGVFAKFFARFMPQPLRPVVQQYAEYKPYVFPTFVAGAATIGAMFMLRRYKRNFCMRHFQRPTFRIQRISYVPVQQPRSGSRSSTSSGIPPA